MPSGFVTRACRVILPAPQRPEGWPSGLRRTLGKRVYGKPYRGFESHSLRHRPRHQILQRRTIGSFGPAVGAVDDGPLHLARSMLAPFVLRLAIFLRGFVPWRSVQRLELLYSQALARYIFRSSLAAPDGPHVAGENRTRRAARGRGSDPMVRGGANCSDEISIAKGLISDTNFLEAQREAVNNYLNGGSWSLVREFTEVESGKRNDRPQLAAALAMAKKNRPKLVIAKLDRLSRNLAFVAKLLDSGVEFVAADNPHANKMALQVYAVFAEFEREQIVKRTRDALQAAKARGVGLGSPKLELARPRSWQANRQAADRYAANALPIIREIQSSGVKSLRAVARALTARGIETRRGGAWSPVQVGNLLRRDLSASS